MRRVLRFATVAVVAVVAASGCGSSGGDNGEAGTGSTSNGSDSGLGSVSGPPPISTGTFTTMGSPADSSSSATTSSPGDTSEDAESGSAPGNEGCEASCLLEVDCGFTPDQDTCVEQCQRELAGLDRPCLDAITALYLCLADLSCEDFVAWNDGVLMPDPCADQGAEAAALCGS